MSDFDELESFLKKVALSEDITKGRDLSLHEVRELVELKFSHDFSSSGFNERFIEIKEEIDDEIKEIVSMHSPGGFNKENLLAALRVDIDAKYRLRTLILARKACRELDEEYRLEFEDHELLAKVADAVLAIAQTWIGSDLVPLASRAIYASDVANAIEFWDANKDSDEGKLEKTWQIALETKKAVLERILGAKMVVFAKQASVGSSNISGKGDKFADFLARHGDTRNTVIVEIKNPHTKLLAASLYRNTYGLSAELSGTISQVLIQRNELVKNFYQKSRDGDFEVHSPRCVIIAGSIETEINDKTKVAAFEIQRNAISSNVQVITFDELYENFRQFNVMT